MSPGTNAGTGRPLNFCCAKCRRVDHQHRQKLPVTLTGKRRHLAPGNYGNRNGEYSVQYTCACGHTGWSRHYDINRRFEREVKS